MRILAQRKGLGLEMLRIAFGKLYLIFSNLTSIGITKTLPFGKSWKQIPGLTVFTHSTIGRSVVFGVDSFKNIYRGSLAAVAGKVKV